MNCPSEYTTQYWVWPPRAADSAVTRRGMPSTRCWIISSVRESQACWTAWNTQSDWWVDWPCHGCTTQFGPTHVQWGSYPKNLQDKAWPQRALEQWDHVCDARLRVPSTNTNSDLAPWRIAPQTMTLAVLLPWVSSAQSSSSLSPCLLCTSRRP